MFFPQLRKQNKKMNATNWTPEQEILTYVVDVLRESFVPDTEIQKSVQQKMAAMRMHPDFINYLLHVLADLDKYSEDVRALSGIVLKNNLDSSSDRLTDETVKHLKAKLIVLMGDPSKEVRSTVTSLMTALISKIGFEGWPELLPHFVRLLESPDENLCETVLSALYKICEDFFSRKDPEHLNGSFKELFVKFMQLVVCRRTRIRKESLKILNLILQNFGANFFDSAEYLSRLFEIVDDNDPEVQKYICEGFLTYIENKDIAVLPHVQFIAEFMLSRSQFEDKDVALQASEFWLAFANLPNCKGLIQPFKDRLLCLLLKNMRYSEYELNCLKDVVYDDNHVPDELSDVRPFNAEDENDFDDSYVGWTLRKCSAAALDNLSHKLGEDLLPTFIPLLNEALNSDDLLIRESGILALGAIAEGCYEPLKQHLPDLVTYLMGNLSNSHNLIKTITFWTISRYMSWIVNVDPPDLYFVPIMGELLRHILDNNKRVQRSSLSALCVFLEESRLKLLPYLEFIVNTFLQAMDHCKFRSYYLLYDAIGALALSVRNNLNKPDYVERLVVPLIQKFVLYADFYEDQFLALTECLSNIVTAIEVAFLPYTEVVFDRCLYIINVTMNSIHLYAEKPEDYPVPDKDPMCVVHDLLLTLASSLKPYFVKYVTNSNLTQQLYLTMQDDTPSIRQSAFALFGELVRICYSFLSPQIHEYIPVIVENLDVNFEAVCNNAAWVLGELCMAMGNSIEPFARQIMVGLMGVLRHSDGSKSMHQTAAITLCSLGYICPNVISGELRNMMRPCCQAMRNVRDCVEKEMGFRGLCVLICHDPDVLLDNFGYFCDAVASWEEVRPDLKENVKNIVISFKQRYGAETFDLRYNHFPEVLKIRLGYLYGI